MNPGVEVKVSLASGLFQVTDGPKLVGEMASREGYDELFRTDYPRVVRTAQMIVQSRSAAEDVAQEAFIRLYRHWPKVARYDQPYAWVRRVAIRLAVKAQRRERLNSMLKTDKEPAQTDAVYDHDLMTSISKLSGRQRAAVILFYLEDRPLSEIAQILECSEATAAVHVHRARKKLAGMLGEPREELTEHVC